MERPSMVTIDSYYLNELKKKALAWDELQKELNEMQADIIKNKYMDNSLSLGDKIDPTRAVPIGQTIIVTNLPPTVSGAELMYSFLAPGGIRYYKLFFESKDGIQSLTALVTFVTSDAANNYLGYVSKCGAFFVSEKLREDHNESPGAGEFLKISPHQRFQFLLKPCPDVTIRLWEGIERVAGKLITGDEGGYCNVSQEINQGATRVLIISPGIEAKELHEELRHLVAVPELRIELNRFLPATLPRKGMVTIVRLCSVRDAVMVKSYLSLLKGYSGPDGRAVRYCKDPTDHPSEELDWHTLTNPKKENNPATSVDSNLDASEPSDVNPKSKANTTPAAEVDTVHYLSDTGDSDTESDMRELSFSLAKQAFLPHIPTSPHKVCFTTLCHTPALGDHTPAPPESEPENNVDLENHGTSEDKSRLVAPDANSNVSVSVTATNADLGSKPDDIPRRFVYPHGTSLSQGRAAGQIVAGALNNIGSLGTIGGMKKLETAVSSPNITWAKNVDRLSPNGETVSDSSPPLVIESVGPSFNGRGTTLQKLRKEEAILLSMQKVVVAAEILKTELEESAKRLELETQALEVVNLNQSQSGTFKSGEQSLKEQLTERFTFQIGDNFLGEWGDDF